MVVLFLTSYIADENAIDKALEDYFENPSSVDNDQIEFGLLFTAAVDVYFDEIIIRLPQKITQ